MKKYLPPGNPSQVLVQIRSAFIGIVPNEIYYPVLNPDYDPVAANAAMQFDLLRKKLAQADNEEAKKGIEEKIESAKKGLEDSRDNIKTEIKRKEDIYSKAVAKRDAAKKEWDDAQKKLDDLGPPAADEDDKKETERKTATENAQAKRGSYQRAEADAVLRKKLWTTNPMNSRDLEGRLNNPLPSSPGTAEQYIKQKLQNFSVPSCWMIC